MLFPCSADPGPLNAITGNIVPGRFCSPMVEARFALIVLGYAPFWFKKRLYPAAARLMSEHDVVTKPAMFVDRAENGHVVLRHYYDRRHEERVSAREVLWIGAQRARDGLTAELRQAGIADVRTIGDAFAPRRLSYAIAEGQRAGRL